jgi:hypothetical protein
MSRRPIGDRGTSFTISQIISALDDRNVLRAMRLLEPAAESSELSPKDQDDARRCVKCTSRGE